MTRAAANRLLDFVRAGGLASDADVLLALWVTGDLFATRGAECFASAILPVHGEVKRGPGALQPLGFPSVNQRP